MFNRLSDPRLAVFLDHYLEVRGERTMPSRQDIDALRLGPVLPFIWLSDYEAAHDTFRYRLAGEEVNAVFGSRITGKLLSEIVKGGRFPTVNELFLRVVNEKLALHAEGPIYRCTDRMTLGERLVLPLSSDGGTADGLVGVTVRGDSIDLVNSAHYQEQKYDFLPVDELTEPSSSFQRKRAIGSGC
ncbi:PAS domain-containing protein [Pelagibius sp. Alg239-R121]|uniref:PAS domain-containing protein n=1 Tax=Pelagibius sp. Alg239-R121 TaxID=2993448 RepID=UPI0024A75140|nr:PAS domain-containing protein [Pelagibius sp. Alg239-R121]